MAMALSSGALLFGASPAVLADTDSTHPPKPPRTAVAGPSRTEPLSDLRGEVRVAGALAYMAAAAGVLVVDVETPWDVPIVAQIDLPGETRGLTLVDPAAPRPLVAVCNGEPRAPGRDALLLLRPTAPEGAQLVGAAYAPAGVALREPSVAGELVLARTETGFAAFDISDPSSPTFTALYDALAQPGAGRVVDVEGAEGAAYVLVEGTSPCLQVVDLADPENPEWVDTILNRRDRGPDGGLSRDPHRSLLALRTGTDYHLLDLRAPLAPVLLRTVVAEDHSGSSTISLGAPRLAVADPASIVDAFQDLSIWSTGSDTPVSAIRLEPGEARAAVLDDGRIVVRSRGGQHVWDETRYERIRILDTALPPGPPSRIGELAIPEAGCAPELAVLGDSIALVAYDGRIGSVDLRDPEQPVWLGSSPFRGYLICQRPSEMVVREDGIGLLADGNGGLHIFDASDPAAVQVLATLSMDAQAVDLEGNIAAVGGRDDEAGEEGWVRVTLLDIADPSAPVLLGEWGGSQGDPHCERAYENGGTSIDANKVAMVRETRNSPMGLPPHAPLLPTIRAPVKLIACAFRTVIADPDYTRFGRGDNYASWKWCEMPCKISVYPRAPMLLAPLVIGYVINNNAGTRFDPLCRVVDRSAVQAITLLSESIRLTNKTRDTRDCLAVQ